MPPTILILTEFDDVHAYAVAEALGRKGAEACVWHTTDFPTRSGESILISGNREEIRVQGPGVSLRGPSLEAVQTVWRRRPACALPGGVLHPADRKFAEIECNAFRRALLEALSPQAWWVNSPMAALRADSKPAQHRAALLAGFSVPDTLYSNDPDAIRTFIRQNDGTVVYKPFRGTSWSNGMSSWATYTSRVSEAQLVDEDLLRLTPGIFQAEIKKEYELRVTLMGARGFTAQIHSQGTRKGRLDWRRAYDELVFSPFALPPEVAARCRAVMASLGIVFGCFDLVVTPEGDYVFLEVNEMGQFLFIEHYSGLPLLDAFAEFLIQGREDFVWAEGVTTIRYAEVQERVAQRSASAAEVHFKPPPVVNSESEAL